MSPREAYRLFAPPMTRMHCAFLAPELSATSSMVLGWIISVSGGPGHDFPDPPALLLGQGPRLLEEHAIARLARVRLVVGLEPLGVPHHALVARVTVHPLDEHHAGLRHLVADHHAFSGLRFRHRRLLRPSRCAARAGWSGSWRGRGAPARRARDSWPPPWTAGSAG